VPIKLIGPLYGEVVKEPKKGKKGAKKAATTKDLSPMIEKSSSLPTQQLASLSKRNTTKMSDYSSNSRSISPERDQGDSLPLVDKTQASPDVKTTEIIDDDVDKLT
jgi:hypothetical protein